MKLVRLVFFIAITTGFVALDTQATRHWNHEHARRSAQGKWIALGAIGAAGTGVAMYALFKKTSKAVLCDRVYEYKRLYCDYNVSALAADLLKADTIMQACCAMQRHADAVDIVYLMHNKVFGLRDEMAKRYDSWVRFWNHSTNMQEARPEIEKLYVDTMTIYLATTYFQTYADLVAVKEYDKAFEDRIRSFMDRDTQFPLMEAVAKIKLDRATVERWITKKPEFRFLRHMKLELDGLIKNIRKYKGYAQEVHQKEMLDLERERLEQEKRRVRAEEERLKIDRERLAMERNKLREERDNFARYRSSY